RSDRVERIAGALGSTRRAVPRCRGAGAVRTDLLGLPVRLLVEVQPGARAAGTRGVRLAVLSPTPRPAGAAGLRPPLDGDAAAGPRLARVWRRALRSAAARQHPDRDGVPVSRAAGAAAGVSRLARAARGVVPAVLPAVRDAAADVARRLGHDAAEARGVGS